MGEIPKEWKPAGTGEEEFDIPLYDTEGGLNAADTNIQFFDQGEAAVGIDETNMPKASELPSTQRFLVKKIEVFVNDVSAAADEHTMLDRSVLEMKINSKRVFVAPLRLLMGGATVLPAGVTQDEDHVAGFGYDLDRYIVIPGGTQFSVVIETAQTATGADMELTVALRGRWVRPAA